MPSATLRAVLARFYLSQPGPLGLTPLERGRHALAATTKYGATGKESIAKYAERVMGKAGGTASETHAAQQTVSRQVCAYKVFSELHNIVQPDHYFHQFHTIHAAPDHLWKELAERMIDEGWTVATTRAEVQPRGCT